MAGTKLVTSGLLALLTICLGYWINRASFGVFISAYGLFFALYVWLITRRSDSADQRWWIGLGIVLRLCLLFSLPNLSDDFYRFLWDGRLTAQGIHPFAYLPSHFITSPQTLPGITPELYHLLNSPEYYTVYPPVSQGAFWLAAKLFPTSIPGGVLVLKAILFCCELATIGLLAATERTFPARPFAAGRAMTYALNPLLILEIAGNCHFEGAMLFFLLSGLYFLHQKRWVKAAGFWALATASKLVPLLFIPVIWVRLGWRNGGRLMVWCAVFTTLLFLPLLEPEILRKMASSLNLYFRQFAFNASIYYVLKMAGKALLPPDVDVGRTLGPILAALVFAGVWGIALWSRRIRKSAGQVPLYDLLLLVATLYLALATTVHPWYITLPFGLGLFTRRQFPLIWTGVAALSYSHYSGGHYTEKYELILLEYGCLGVAILLDILRSRRIGGAAVS